MEGNLISEKNLTCFIIFGLFRQELLIKKIFPHEKFQRDGTNRGNDIALIKLEKSLDSSYMPACLAPKLADYTGNTAATLYGWGAFAEINFRDNEGECIIDENQILTRSPVLRTTNTTIISNRECRKGFGLEYTCGLVLKIPSSPNGTRGLKHFAKIGAQLKIYNQSIFEEMMCTVNEGRSECKGDSGGPLTVNENGKHILVGVVSWSIGCAKVISIIYVGGTP